MSADFPAWQVEGTGVIPAIASSAVQAWVRRVVPSFRRACGTWRLRACACWSARGRRHLRTAWHGGSTCGKHACRPCCPFRVPSSLPGLRCRVDGELGRRQTPGCGSGIAVDWLAVRRHAPLAVSPMSRVVEQRTQFDAVHPPPEPSSDHALLGAPQRAAVASTCANLDEIRNCVLQRPCLRHCYLAVCAFFLVYPYCR